MREPVDPRPDGLPHDPHDEADEQQPEDRDEQDGTRLQTALDGCPAVAADGRNSRHHRLGTNGSSARVQVGGRDPTVGRAVGVRGCVGVRVLDVDLEDDGAASTRQTTNTA